MPICTGFKLMSEATLHAYRATLDWYGYSVDDFELKERFDPPPKADTGHTWGFVVVTRKSTGVTRYYRAGPALHWTDAFEQDIRRGVFSRH